jgi:hypothetical protein
MVAASATAILNDITLSTWLGHGGREIPLKTQQTANPAKQRFAANLLSILNRVR